MNKIILAGLFLFLASCAFERTERTAVIFLASENPGCNVFEAGERTQFAVMRDNKLFIYYMNADAKSTIDAVSYKESIELQCVDSYAYGYDKLSCSGGALYGK